MRHASFCRVSETPSIKLSFCQTELCSIQHPILATRHTCPHPSAPRILQKHISNRCTVPTLLTVLGTPPRNIQVAQVELHTPHVNPVHTLHTHSRHTHAYSHTHTGTHTFPPLGTNPTAWHRSQTPVPIFSFEQTLRHTQIGFKACHLLHKDPCGALAHKQGSSSLRVLHACHPQPIYSQGTLTPILTSICSPAHPHSQQVHAHHQHPSIILLLAPVLDNLPYKQTVQHTQRKSCRPCGVTLVLLFSSHSPITVTTKIKLQGRVVSPQHCLPAHMAPSAHQLVAAAAAAKAPKPDL